MVVIVLGADDFAQRAAVCAPVTLNRIPWRREGARVFHVDIHLKHLAVVDHMEALYHVQLIGVRRLIVVDVRLAGDSDRIDDERVAFVLNDRFAIPIKADARMGPDLTRSDPARSVAE